MGSVFNMFLFIFEYTFNTDVEHILLVFEWILEEFHVLFLKIITEIYR
jgi:hypothetical protein